MKFMQVLRLMINTEVYDSIELGVLLSDSEDIDIPRLPALFARCLTSNILCVCASLSQISHYTRSTEYITFTTTMKTTAIFFLTFVTFCYALPFPGVQRITRDVDLVKETDRLLFTASMADFQTARNAQNPAGKFESQPLDNVSLISQRPELVLKWMHSFSGSTTWL